MCGAALVSGDRFCGACGAPAAAADESSAAPASAPASTPPAAPVPTIVPSYPPAGAAPPGGGYAPAVPAPAAPVGMTYASFWARVGATLLDALLVHVGVLVAFFIGGAIASVSVGLGWFVGGVLIFAVYVAYMPFFWWWKNGRTIGQMAAGTRTVRTSGDLMTFWRGVGRTAAMYLVIGVGSNLTFGIVGILDCLWMLWDARNQTLHDKMADTIVVYAAGSEGARRPGAIG